MVIATAWKPADAGLTVIREAHCAGAVSHHFAGVTRLPGCAGFDRSFFFLPYIMRLSGSQLSITSLRTVFSAAAVALLLQLAPTAELLAQPGSNRAAPAATTDGVYTSMQARAGGDVYAGLCQSCHSAESHTGAPFRNNWVGKPLSALYSYISNEMPKTEPGSLTEEEYTLVLAYILRMNGMPAGRKALTADSAALDAITIVLPGSAPRR